MNLLRAEGGLHASMTARTKALEERTGGWPRYRQAEQWQLRDPDFRTFHHPGGLRGTWSAASRGTKGAHPQSQLLPFRISALMGEVSCKCAS